MSVHEAGDRQRSQQLVAIGFDDRILPATKFAQLVSTLVVEMSGFIHLITNYELRMVLLLE